MNAITWTNPDEKGDGPDMIVDDGGDMTLLVHEGVKAEDTFAKDGTVPDPASTDNAEFKIVLQLICRTLKTDPKKWNKVNRVCVCVCAHACVRACTCVYVRVRVCKRVPPRLGPHHTSRMITTYRPVSTYVHTLPRPPRSACVRRRHTRLPPFALTPTDTHTHTNASDRHPLHRCL